MSGKRAQLLVGVLQSLFYLFALADVHKASFIINYPTTGITDSFGVILQPDYRTIVAATLHFKITHFFIAIYQLLPLSSIIRIYIEIGCINRQQGLTVWIAEY